LYIINYVSALSIFSIFSIGGKYLISRENYIFVSYNNEDVNVVRTEIGSSQENYNLMFASDGSSFNAGELCGRDIGIDISVKSS
jgi:hypothetical protein